MRNKSSLAAIAILGLLVLPKLGYLSSITEERIIELTNKERLKYDIAPLEKDDKLAAAALSKGRHILDTQKFQHNFEDRKFSAWVRESGYEYQFAGENLAIDFFTSEGAMRAWMASPTHKENIVNEKFEDIGVAVIEGDYEGHKAIVIVQIFGTKSDKGLITGSAEGLSPKEAALQKAEIAPPQAPPSVLDGKAARQEAFENTIFQSVALAIPIVVIFLAIGSIKIRRSKGRSVLLSLKSKPVRH